MKINHPLIACLEAAVLAARQNPDSSAYRIGHAIHDLHKIGQRLHRRYEADCSSPYADNDSYRRRTERLEDRAHSIAADMQLTLGFQRDPRGWPLILQCGNAEVRIGGAP